MFFYHDPAAMRAGKFRFSGQQTATAHRTLCKAILRELWHGYTYHVSDLATEETDALLFRLGDVKAPVCKDASYAIRVTERGVAVTARDADGLRQGYLTLLDMIAMEEEGELTIPCCEMAEKPQIAVRMVHFCVFPETELWEIDKFLRLCGALKYTHVVLEFWGMLRYDCLPTLAWSHAFTKEQIRPLVTMARDLGLSVVPMFNGWGHAAASRMCHGKHAVLDSDPSLAYLFDDTGWCWNYRSPKVRALLRRVRAELIDLCGESEYFHIGCDEADGFTFTEANMTDVCDYIHEVAEELAATGRRAIMWGDMLLFRHPTYDRENPYTANCPSREAEAFMLSHLDRRILIADWQYDCQKAPVETALRLRAHGFDVLLCPWDRGERQSNACLATVKEAHLFGILHTTWHTLSAGMPYVGGVALACWDKGSVRPLPYTTAAVLRKVRFADGDWRRAGWAKEEIDALWA